jgi:pyruvate dehydrogenase E1 component
VPNLVTYDPAFAYEIAVIIREGIRRMYGKREDIFYYLTLTNENYQHPPMPESNAIREGILRGMYKLKSLEAEQSKLRTHLFASGPIVNEALKAQQMLADKYDVASDVWSLTSYKEIYRDGNEAERWNMLHPSEKPRVPYITQCVGDGPGVFVAASDYVKALPDSISQWLPGPLVSLGTDGFGRSDSRAALRDFFEVDARFITLATLAALARQQKIKANVVERAMRELEIDPEKVNPRLA